MLSGEVRQLAQKILESAERASSLDPSVPKNAKEVKEQIDRIGLLNNQILNQLTHGKPSAMKKGNIKLTRKEKKKLLNELNLDEGRIKEFLKYRDKIKKEEAQQAYVLYKPSAYGKIANFFVEKISFKLAKSHPKFFEKLAQDLRRSGIKVISKTYMSMMIFSSILAFVIVTVVTSLLFKHPMLPVQVARGVSLGMVAAAVTAAIFYLYPTNAAGEKEKKIQQDLPFAIIHMASVAGSGARPIAIFQNLLASGEYPNLRDEIKKIVNYVNVFGYDLTTALVTVARTTPSAKFKDLLDGMVSNITSGGDLKEYLQAKADEALTSYRLMRKKYVEVIATYSDIYTALLIAAPLLFFVTLAIIQMLGGSLGGLGVNLIASIGTYGVIPLLNIGYLIFISVVQPK